MSIRIRLVIMCLAVALLPAIPLSLLVQSLLEKSFNVGLNDTVEQALQSGLVISRERLEQTRSAFEAEVDQTVSVLGEYGIVSALGAMDLSGTDGSPGRIDGFIVGRTGPAADWDGDQTSAKTRLAAFTADSVFTSLIEGRDISLRPAEAGGSPELEYYETADRSALMAVWRPSGSGPPSAEAGGGASPSVLFYKRIDPEFLAQADRLITGRQIFAQLRLTQGELNRSFLYPFIIIYAVMLLLALSLALMMAERLARPIRRLAQGTRIVGGGDWSYREKSRAGGETGQLIDGFNSMISRLQQQQRRLLDMEKMAAWREMARRLAHEIKNPLLPIRLTVDELKDQYKGDDPAYGKLLADSTRVVGEELSSLQKLVKEFSSFARMPDMAPRPGSLPQLVEDVARLYTKPEANIKAAPDVPEINFDPDQLRRVLVNLFENSSNALEGRADGKIQIDLYLAGGQVVIEFTDNGPGIPLEALPKIFDPYFTTRAEGTGLGLAMVKNIILLHGGSVEAASATGQGTVFTIRVPAEPPPREGTGPSSPD